MPRRMHLVLSLALSFQGVCFFQMCCSPRLLNLLFSLLANARRVINAKNGWTMCHIYSVGLNLHLLFLDLE